MRLVVAWHGATPVGLEGTPLSRDRGERLSWCSLGRHRLNEALAFIRPERAPAIPRRSCPLNRAVPLDASIEAETRCATSATGGWHELGGCRLDLDAALAVAALDRRPAPAGAQAIEVLVDESAVACRARQLGSTTTLPSAPPATASCAAATCSRR